MDKDKVINFIQKQYHDGYSLYSVKSNSPDIFNAAKKYFGSWKNAVKESGLNYKNITKCTKEEIINLLQSLPEEDLTEKSLKTKHRALYNTCIKIFGSRKKALIYANIDYESTLQNIPWTRERIISSIQIFHLKKIPLNFKYINTYHTNLRKHAEKFFGSWREAVEIAGINYDEVKKNKGWAKPSLGEDGILYTSQIESLIANKLYGMKNEKKIIDYTPQTEIIPGRKWTCDFSVNLLNGTELLLEIDDLKDNKKKSEQFKEKLDFYDQAKILYYKIFSPSNVENIIDRYTNWYTIPNTNSIITSHKNPDGDALAASVALYKNLESKGKKVSLKFSGKIPKNLEWIISECNISKKIPDWTETIIVLDCAPTLDRLGWELPNNIPIYNIDHHASRITDNDPDNDIHVIDACSTSSILFNFFGIKDDILVVGVYTDTLFTKRLTEVFNFISKSGIDENIINKYISKINANPDKKLWNLLDTSNFQRCRNGFVIVEIAEESPDIIESFIQILSKISESVCLIYGRNHSVKLRTSNTSLDVSIIAKEYSGGGHPYASMCNVDGKVSEFKAKIRSLSVLPINEKKTIETKDITFLEENVKNLIARWNSGKLPWHLPDDLLEQVEWCRLSETLIIEFLELLSSKIRNIILKASVKNELPLDIYIKELAYNPYFEVNPVKGSELDLNEKKKYVRFRTAEIAHFISIKCNIDLTTAELMWRALVVSIKDMPHILPYLEMQTIGNFDYIKIILNNGIKK